MQLLRKAKKEKEPVVKDSKILLCRGNSPDAEAIHFSRVLVLHLLLFQHLSHMMTFMFPNNTYIATVGTARAATALLAMLYCLSECSVDFTFSWVCRDWCALRRLHLYINLTPIHMLLCIATGCDSPWLYFAYAPFVVLGTLLVSLVLVVGSWLQSRDDLRTLPGIFGWSNCRCGNACSSGGLQPPTKGWSGRKYFKITSRIYPMQLSHMFDRLLEHQLPTWQSYIMDINILAFLVPAGIIACFLPLSDASSFAVHYIVTSVYFRGVVVFTYHHTPFDGPKEQDRIKGKTGMRTVSVERLTRIIMSENSKLSEWIFDYPLQDFIF
ncbi:hypothetical protein C5167_029543 [Papaver somniferum]|nr:hypothetical protein C5167_029543 [Papaver somniferum]